MLIFVIFFYKLFNGTDKGAGGGWRDANPQDQDQVQNIQDSLES